MTVVTAYLGLGSNLGDREENLRKALALFGERVRLVAVSSVYETEPWGYTSQPSFLNLVCAVETTLAPEELLALAKEVEGSLGRVPTFRNGPRIMDVDVLLYGDLVMETAALRIPHPGITERAFVLVPLAEIAPGLVHPVQRGTVGELLAEVFGKEGVRRLGGLLPDAPAGR